MKKIKTRMLSALFLVFLLFATAVCASAQEQPDGSEVYKIGVVVYDPEAQEMKMFMNYYRDYLEEGFPVKFYFSGQVTSADEENEFILSAKEAGVQGIISFGGMDVENTLSVCEENRLYYVLGSSIISDEVYEAVKENPWYLGSVGPNLELVYESGRSMAQHFLDCGAQNFVVMTGGAAFGNSLHEARTRGMLDVLEEAGLVLGKTVEELAASRENVTLTSEDGALTATLCPDYTEGGDGLVNLEAAFADGKRDVLMSAFHAGTYLDKISEKEASQGANIMVGAIDSFTEANFEAIKEEDAFGNPKIDYVEGKYASMAGPAFAILYNAITGYPETNTPDGNAVRLYQGFWRADSRESFIELYGYTTGIYENAYSCDDLMQVIRAYHEDASPEALKELTEAYSVEAVKNRILKQK